MFGNYVEYATVCGNTQTLLHVLAGCKTMLDQGRYTWRHNCVLNHIERYIRGLTNNANIISDLPGRSLSRLTIPPEVLVTSARPDLVIHYSDANGIKITELTVPFETNIEKEHAFKTNKYATPRGRPELSSFSKEYTEYAGGGGGGGQWPLHAF